jgi:hypothetical protein
MPSSVEPATDILALREADLARGNSASKIPEPKAVQEYEDAQRTSMVQLIRGGTVLVLLLHLAYLVADSYRVSALRPMLLLDSACVIVGLGGFAVTHTQWFIRHWQATALFICTLGGPGDNLAYHRRSRHDPPADHRAAVFLRQRVAGAVVAAMAAESERDLPAGDDRTGDLAPVR